MIPPVVRFGGRRLGPLTIGHLMLLRRVDCGLNPLSIEDGVREMTVGDVALTWYIVSRPWQEARDGLGTARARVALWLFCIRFVGKHRAAGAALLEWMTGQCALPPFESRNHGSDNEESDPRGTPHELILAQSVCRCWGLSWIEAKDLPVAEANWLLLARWEESQSVVISSTAVDAEADALRRANDPELAAKREQWARSHEARLRGQTT